MSKSQALPDEITTALAKSKRVISVTAKTLAKRDEPKPSQGPPADLAVLFKQLLASLRYTTTSLSLAFKPPITAAAVLQQLTKFTDEVCRAVSFCIAAANGAGLSSTLLLTEWTDGVLDLIAEAQRYIDTISTGDYLQLTGMVWSAVDKMADLSANEAAALGKRWAEDTATIKDAWGELQDLLSEEPSMADALDDEVLSPEERGEAERVKPILGLYRILQATLARDFSSLNEVSLKEVLRISNAFCAAYDDAVCSLHPPQAGTELEDLQQAADDLIQEAQRLGLASDFIRRWQEKRAEMT